MRSDGSDNGKFFIGIDLNSHHEDFDWYIGLYVEVDHEQLDNMIDTMRTYMKEHLGSEVDGV